MNDNKAFVSGSHVYGTPNEDSDIDLIVMMDESLAKWLYEMAETDDCSHTPACGSLSVRFGKINLICCWEQWVYDLWFNGTSLLHGAKPVTRDTAIILFESLRFKNAVRNNTEQSTVDHIYRCNGLQPPPYRIEKLTRQQYPTPIDDIPY